MKGVDFGFEYFWAILLLFIMERICCLQEQFDKDFLLLPDPPRNDDISYDSENLEEFADRDGSLKLSFLRLYRLAHLTMLLTLVFCCNVCFWFIMSNRLSPKILTYRFRISLPS